MSNKKKGGKEMNVELLRREIDLIECDHVNENFGNVKKL